MRSDTADIAATGATHVRIPVGDWMFEPYDIYAVEEDGVRCTDGSREELDRVLGLCRKYGLKALPDMHAWIRSQNGLDNSGDTKNITCCVATTLTTTTHCTHPPPPPSPPPFIARLAALFHDTMC